MLLTCRCEARRLSVDWSVGFGFALCGAAPTVSRWARMASACSALGARVSRYLMIASVIAPRRGRPRLAAAAGSAVFAAAGLGLFLDPFGRPRRTAGAEAAGGVGTAGAGAAVPPKVERKLSIWSTPACSLAISEISSLRASTRLPLAVSIASEFAVTIVPTVFLWLVAGATALRMLARGAYCTTTAGRCPIEYHKFRWIPTRPRAAIAAPRPPPPAIPTASGTPRPSAAPRRRCRNPAAFA